ncbi:hypothetical protein AB4851_07955 [Burkholderia sp. 22PA0099]|uniref:hypothetical protein n=1 Tax=Burkholderia sp. 22PA0099 TaxID=3237372 RepID=UPI0039C35D2E
MSFNERPSRRRLQRMAQLMGFGNRRARMASRPRKIGEGQAAHAAHTAHHSQAQKKSADIHIGPKAGQMPARINSPGSATNRVARIRSLRAMDICASGAKPVTISCHGVEATIGKLAAPMCQRL